MKTNTFAFHRQRRLLMSVAATLFVFSAVFRASAQPGGCYRLTWKTEYCREERTKLLQRFTSEIEHLDNLIARDPKTAEHYYQRGKIYAGMFHSYFGAKDVEFDGKIYFADVDAKAIDDYTRAIQLAPKAEYFADRGRIYLLHWENETSNFQYLQRGEKNTDEEIRQTVDKLFIYNERFEAAERDFVKGIELSADYETSRTAREWLYALRNRRATALHMNQSIAKLIGDGKPADVALGDFDYVIEFYKLYKARNPRNEAVTNLLYGSWIQKGVAAKRFGRDDTALEAFSAAEKAQLKNSYPDCQLYHNRAEIFSKRANYETAIKDVTFAIENNLNCKRMNELLGDIYLVKGDLTSAIDSYSVILNDPHAYKGGIYWKRGKVYLQTGDAQKAIDDFTSGIGISTLCEKDYQLRAQAFRLAGDTQAAEADEERARQTLKEQKKYTGSEYCHYHTN